MRQFDDQLKTCVADCSISLEIGLAESVMHVLNLLNSANYIKFVLKESSPSYELNSKVNHTV